METGQNRFPDTLLIRRRFEMALRPVELGPRRLGFARLVPRPLGSFLARSARRKLRSPSCVLVAVLALGLASCSEDGGASVEPDLGADITDIKGAGVSSDCPPGLSSCEGLCVSLETNRAHCGRCYRPCDEGELCAAGVCALSCQTGFVECDGTCVDPQISGSYCGASGDCAGENAGETCGDGEVCAPGELCAGGVCSLTCQPDFVACDGTCVDPQTRRQHCGATGDCLGENAGVACEPDEACLGSECAVVCQAGQIMCDDICVDPLTDLQHCGAEGDCVTNDGTECAPGQVCSAGECATSCQSELVECDGLCVDSAVDREHCDARGDCTDASSGSADYVGASCRDDQLCVDAHCLCPYGLVECGTAFETPTCVDPLVDSRFCGQPDETCRELVDCSEAGAVCVAGRCVDECAEPLTACGEPAECVDTQNDPRFCGATPDTCEEGVLCRQPWTVNADAAVCVSGHCRYGCDWPWADCNNTADEPNQDGCETNILADMYHCGACGYECQPGQVCVEGACWPRCEPPMADCNDNRPFDGCESDTSSDSQNCSVCGSACAPGLRCVQGTCGTLAFVTRDFFEGDLGGSARASMICQDIAEELQLGGFWLAWLSSFYGAPEDHFVESPHPYLTASGDVIADDWDDLTDGSLQHPLNIDEYGSGLTGSTHYHLVWTSTVEFGMSRTSGNCLNWTSSDYEQYGYVGFAHSTDEHWTREGVEHCDYAAKLYCFEQWQGE